MVLWSAAAGGVGGLAGWALAEPLAAANSPEPTYAVYVGVAGYFLMLSAAVGAILGSLPGVLNRSLRQAVRGAVRAGLVGGLGGALGALPAQYLYNALGDGVLARALGWAFVGAAIGLCPGIATRDRRRALRGLVGGWAGGFVGGLLFDLIGAVVMRAATDTGTLNRFVSDLVVGLCIGVMVALVEVAARTAWLVAVNGKRGGAQFILSKDTTSIGRDDRDDVILWGDPQMATRHARILRAPGGFVLERLSQEAPTLVNGRCWAGPTMLRDGDEIQLGSTQFRFHTRRLPAQQNAPAGELGRVTAAPSAVATAVPAGASAASVQTTRARVHSLPESTLLSSSAARSDRAAGDVPASNGGTRVGPDFRLVTDRGAVLPLPQRTVVTVGRAPGNDIVLAHDTVSARHAELRRHNTRWVVVDLASTNGTFVSASGLPHQERRVAQADLSPGATVRFGGVVCRLESVSGS
jgi:pSer/pThr/pTyr-binding forkhead associated (FHA) protein